MLAAFVLPAAALGRMSKRGMILVERHRAGLRRVLKIVRQSLADVRFAPKEAK